MLDNNASFRKQVTGLSGEGVEIEIFSIPEMTKTQLWTLIYFTGYLTKLVNTAVHVHQPHCSSLVLHSPKSSPKTINLIPLMPLTTIRTPKAKPLRTMI
jgi:hypothetical protein